MVAIETRYVGPSSVRGSRIIAKGNGNRVIVSYDASCNSTDAHAKGAAALCAKMGWHGSLIGGGTDAGMAWVWAESADTLTV